MPPFQTLASVAAALGHALLDGVWLGALLAGALAVGLRIFSGVNAASRHALWYAALIAIAALPIAGFAWSVTHAVAVATPVLLPSTTHIASSRSPSTASVLPAVASGYVAASNKVWTSSTGRPTSSRPMQWGVSRAHAAAPATSGIDVADLILGLVIVIAALSAAGLIGVSISLARLLAVKRDSRPFDSLDEARLPRWSARPDIGRPVCLRVSQGVDVPAAVGFFHPAILVPASWPANLDADELDKIVMHEYSHLRRLDDWTAFAQRVAERAFWFNPALRYIASRANLEREIACDDWVISESSSAASYAECLWRIAQFAHMPAAKMPVPAALVTRAQIVERIEHLMNADRDVLPRMRPAVLLAIMPVAAALLVIGVVRAPAITLAAASVASKSATHAAAPAPAWKASIAPAPAPNHATVSHAGAENAAPLKTVALSGNGLDVRSLLQSCSGCDLSGKDMRNADLHGLRLSGDDMSNVDLRGANLRGVHFDGVDLTGARLDNADLTGAVFSGADIRRISWTGAKLDGLHLEGVAIDAAMLRVGSIRWLLGACSGCDMVGLDMRGLDLNGIHLEGADLERADLRGTNLKNAVLDGVDLSGAQLDGTDLTNAQLNGCDLTHVDLRHAHIQGLKLEGADLRHLQFSGLDVRGLSADGADLSGAQLRDVDLSGVRMNGSDFNSADLTGAQLADGEFVGADFHNARLDGANLQRSRLCGYNTFTDGHAVVSQRRKSCADLSGASTQGTDLRGVQICDWHDGAASCRAVSSADLKTYTHSNLIGAILPSF